MKQTAIEVIAENGRVSDGDLVPLGHFEHAAEAMQLVRELPIGVPLSVAKPPEHVSTWWNRRREWLRQDREMRDERDTLDT